MTEVVSTSVDLIDDRSKPTPQPESGSETELDASPRPTGKPKTVTFKTTCESDSGSESPSPSAKKRLWSEAIDDEPCSDNDFSDSPAEDPPKPFKRPRTQSPSHSPDPPSQPPSGEQMEETKLGTSTHPPGHIKKQVRFHPDTINNELWADLYTAKYAMELRARKRKNLKPEAKKEKISLLEAPIKLDEKGQVVHLDGKPMFPEESSLPSPSPSPKQNPMGMRTHPSLARAALCVNSGQEGITPPNSDVEAQSSSHQFTTFKGADIPFQEIDRSSSMHVDYDYDEYGRRRTDMDDVSVPRSSPLPSTRRLYSGMSAAEIEEEKAELRKEKEEREKQERGKLRELPSIYSRPSQRTRKPEMESLMESRVQAPLIGSNAVEASGSMNAEITRCMRLLQAAFTKLPGEEARSCVGALETLTRFQGKRSYAFGYRDGRRNAGVGPESWRGLDITKDSTNGSTTSGNA